METNNRLLRENDVIRIIEEHLTGPQGNVLTIPVEDLISQVPDAMACTSLMAEEVVDEEREA